VSCDDESITNMKFLLYCFQWMSGLKINYHKSEVYVFGVNESRQTEFSNMLNCRKGELPMKYLGFPIHDKKLPVKAFEGLVNKMKGKLQPWKGKHLSYGGRLVLINSSLSSMPIYTMGVHRLAEGGASSDGYGQIAILLEGGCRKVQIPLS